MGDLLAGVFEDLQTDGVDAHPCPERWGEQIRWQAFGDTLAANDPSCAAHILEMESDRVMRSVGRQRGAFARLFSSTEPSVDVLGDLPSELGVRTGPIGGRILYELGVDGAFVMHARGAAARLASLTAGLIEGLLASGGCDADIEVEEHALNAVAIRVTPVPVRRQTPHDPTDTGR